MYEINTKTLPNCFGDFLRIPSETQYYPTRFATSNNYSSFRFNKTNSQRFICDEGSKPWNELPNELKKLKKTRLTKADMPP